MKSVVIVLALLRMGTAIATDELEVKCKEVDTGGITINMCSVTRTIHAKMCLVNKFDRDGNMICAKETKTEKYVVNEQDTQIGE